MLMREYNTQYLPIANATIKLLLDLNHKHKLLGNEIRNSN